MFLALTPDITTCNNDRVLEVVGPTDSCVYGYIIVRTVHGNNQMKYKSMGEAFLYNKNDMK